MSVGLRRPSGRARYPTIARLACGAYTLELVDLGEFTQPVTR